MFGHDSLPSIVYKYGCKPVTDPKVMEQLRLAHQYRNKLAEIELARRKAVDELLCQLSPQLPGVEESIAIAKARLEELRAQVGKRNSERRKREATADARKEIAATNKNLKALRAQRKALRATLFADKNFRSQSKSIKSTDKAAALAARKEFSKTHKLYWGTYLAIEQSAKSFRKGAPPKFRRWHGSGRCCVQFQHGVSWDHLRSGRDARMRIEPTTNIGKQRLARFRIGSQRGKPIFTDVRFYLHRMPPPGIMIKWARLVARRHGIKTDWSLQLVMSHPDGFHDTKVASSGAVGVDIGWRPLDEGLRVAYWFGSDGDSGQLLIPKCELSRWTKVDELQSDREKNFNKIKERLTKWLSDKAGFPEWIVKDLAFIGQWRNPRRLTRTAQRWTRNRFAGDDEMFAAVVAWHNQENRLYDWQENQRAKTLRWRADLYRNFAVKLRRRYRLICVEDIDWRDLQKAPPIEEPVDKASSRRRQRAAPGTLVQTITDKAAEVLRVDPAYTTQRCDACGKIDAFDAKHELIRTCQHCGVTRDQDERAARNLLAASGTVVTETA